MERLSITPEESEEAILTLSPKKIRRKIVKGEGEFAHGHLIPESKKNVKLPPEDPYRQQLEALNKEAESLEK